MARKNQADNEQLPVNAARPMAFISAGMSLGLAFVVYFFFFKDVFTGSLAIVVLLMMLIMTAISSLVALKNVRKKIYCPNCGELFFSGIKAMFLRPAHCAACQQLANSANR